jgi:hypothetical protein
MIGPISGDIFGGQYHFTTVCPILTIPKVYRVKNMKKKKSKGGDRYSRKRRGHYIFALFQNTHKVLFI